LLGNVAFGFVNQMVVYKQFQPAVNVDWLTAKSECEHREYRQQSHDGSF